MSRNEIFQYYVEGDDDKKVIDTLKKDMNCVVSGKVDVFNVVQNELSPARIRTLKCGTTIILVYDTDVERTDTLHKNIDFLKKSQHIKKVLCIPQVRNLENELVRATSVHNVTDILGCNTIKDYKHDLIRCSNLDKKLRNCNFDFSRFWSEVPENCFKTFGNDAHFIKKK